MPIPFKPSPPPYQDFVVSTHPGMAPEFDAARPFNGVVLHLIKSAIFDGRLFSGVSFDGGEKSALGGHGSYNIVETVGDEVHVRSDAFGLGVLYVYEGRYSLASNNLHMLVAVCRQLDLALTINQGAILRRLNPKSIGQQPSSLTTSFKEIRIIQAGRELHFSTAGMVEVQSPKRVFRHYEEAIDAGVEGMRRQVATIARRSDHPVYRLSGGYDSRAVFGALVAEGLLSDAYCWTFPHLEEDFQVVRQLIGHFGGQFADAFPWSVNTEALSVEEAFQSWASTNFGTYATFLGLEAFTRTSFDESTVVVMFGGGGECFRDFYFADALPSSRDGIADRVATVCRNMWPEGSNAPLKIAGLFADEIMKMEGADPAAKLRSYYINLRNRFHFGRATETRANRINASPFMQAGFLAAAEFEADGRKMLADIYDRLHPDLKRIPFDKREKSLGEPLNVEPATYSPRSMGAAYPPRKFGGKDLDQCISDNYSDAVRFIRQSGVYDDFDFDAFLGHAEAQRERSKERHQQFQASIISTHHLLTA